MRFVVRNGVLTSLGDNEAPRDGDVFIYSMDQCATRVQNPDDRTRGGDPENPQRSSIPPQTFTHTQ